MKRLILIAALLFPFAADAQRVDYGPGAGGAATFIYPTCANNTVADTASIQALIDAAPANGATIVLPQSQTCSISSLSITKNNITLSGGNLTLGVGLVAGNTAITIDANNFKARDVVATAAVRVYAFRVEPTAARSNFLFDNISCSGFFYCVFGHGTATFRLANLTVQNSSSTQPAGQNAGAFLVTYTDNYTYRGNRISGGQNTSVLGAQQSYGGRIIGNYERGVVDTAAATEACVQIEQGSVNSDSIIADNDCAHDIWASDSGGVKISNNIARRLRVQVTDSAAAFAIDPDKIEVVGGTYGQVLVGQYGVNPSTNRISAKFANFDLDPARYTLLGAALTVSYSLDARYIGKVTFSNIRNVSNATTRSTSIVRDAAADLFFSDCDFGTVAHISSGGSVGLVNERNNINPILAAGNGYVYAYQGVNIGSPTIGAWTNSTYNITVSNRNGEWASNSFTPLVSGYYEFGCSMGITPTTAGNQLALRLVTDPAGTPAEVARLADVRAQGTNSTSLVCRPFTTYAAAGTVYGFQYWIDGASSVILGSAGLFTTISIRRVAQ